MAQDYELVSPTGHRIIGTLERIYATSRCYLDDPKPDRKGYYRLHYAGETDVHWDMQETFTDANGERIFIDSVYEQWPESEVKVVIINEEAP